MQPRSWEPSRAQYEYVQSERLLGGGGDARGCGMQCYWSAVLTPINNGHGSGLSCKSPPCDDRFTAPDAGRGGCAANRRSSGLTVPRKNPLIGATVQRSCRLQRSERISSHCPCLNIESETDKSLLDGPVYVGKLGIDGHEHDLTFHGGPDKAAHYTYGLAIYWLPCMSAIDPDM